MSSHINLPAYQKSVIDIVEEYPDQLTMNLDIAVLDLVSEVGELAKELLKSNNYGRTTNGPCVVGDNFTQELGDIFYSLIMVANAASIDLDRSLEASISKLKCRLIHKGYAGSESSIPTTNEGEPQHD